MVTAGAGFETGCLHRVRIHTQTEVLTMAVPDCLDCRLREQSDRPTRSNVTLHLCVRSLPAVAEFILPYLKGLQQHAGAQDSTNTSCIPDRNGTQPALRSLDMGRHGKLPVKYFDESFLALPVMTTYPPSVTQASMINVEWRHGRLDPLSAL